MKKYKKMEMNIFHEIMNRNLDLTYHIKYLKYNTQ